MYMSSQPPLDLNQVKTTIQFVSNLNSTTYLQNFGLQPHINTVARFSFASETVESLSDNFITQIHFMNFKTFSH